MCLWPAYPGRVSHELSSNRLLPSLLIHGPWYWGYYPDTSGLRAILCEPFNKIIPHIMQLLVTYSYYESELDEATVYIFIFNQNPSESIC
jgi:hypothetical protein